VSVDQREAEAFLARVTDLAGPPGPATALRSALGSLESLKTPPGGIVILALANGLELLTQYFAVLLAGAVPLAVAPATPAARISALAEHLGAYALIAARVDPARYGADRAHPTGRSQAVLLPGHKAGAYLPGDVLMLTSGTSGMFSACHHDLDALLLNARGHAQAVALGADDVVLVSLPLYYSYAMVAQALAAFVTGARLVVSGPPFAPAAYEAAVTAHRVTSSSITPTIARQLLARGVSLPPGLRMLTVGGDWMAPEHTASLLDLRPDGELYLTYGLTEAGPRVATLAAHAEPARRHASVGLPLPGVRAGLRDTAPDGTGELVVHSPSVMRAKVGIVHPGASRALLAPGTLATGDLFAIDDDGYLLFRGRLADFVLVGGDKVSLFSLRQAAFTVPGVVGCTPEVVTDDDGATRIDLTVRVAEPYDGDERTIRRALSAVLLPAERPRRIVVETAQAAGFRK
jgi:long-chain acyl-CoA synthetase